MKDDGGRSHASGGSPAPDQTEQVLVLQRDLLRAADVEQLARELAAGLARLDGVAAARVVIGKVEAQAGRSEAVATESAVRFALVTPATDYGVFEVFQSAGAALPRASFEGLAISVALQVECLLRGGDGRVGESLASDVLENSRAGVLMADRGGRVVFVNGTFEQFFGVQRDDVLGLELGALVAERLRSSLCDGEAFAQHIASGPSPAQRFECRLLGRAGSPESWLEHHSQPIEAGSFRGGRIDHFYDVSARKAAEAALLDSEANIRSLLEASPVCTKIIGLDSRLRYMSAAGHIRLKIPDVTKLYGEIYPAPIYSEELRAPMTAHLERAKAGEVCSVECPLLDSDGNEVWYHTTFVPILDADGKVDHVVATSVDITSRKEISDDLLRAKEAAESAVRSKSQFLANMSHEIRTPITAILGFADVLVGDGAATAAERSAAAETIKRNSEHLVAIINDILDLSKIEAGKMAAVLEPCAARRIAEEVVALQRVQAEAKGLALALTATPSIPEYVRTDGTRLRQILLNLVGNAIKFTERGSVQLEISYALESDESFIQFDVVDSGRGMSHDEVAALFQPFTQVDTSTTRHHGGTGLGLAISKRFAELLGGDIGVVESRPGAGTRIRLKLPAEVVLGVESAQSLIPSSASLEIEGDPIASRPLEGRRILLAEDGRDNQRLFRVVLERVGAEVEVAENGRVALESALAADAAGSPFDVVLMDMQMPLMDGYEATRALRRSGYRGAVVALTAHAMWEDRQKCMEAGCDDYATKPIATKRLVEILLALSRR